MIKRRIWEFSSYNIWNTMISYEGENFLRVFFKFVKIRVSLLLDYQTIFISGRECKRICIFSKKGISRKTWGVTQSRFRINKNSKKRRGRNGRRSRSFISTRRLIRFNWRAPKIIVIPTFFFFFLTRHNSAVKRVRECRANRRAIWISNQMDPRTGRAEKPSHAVRFLD